MASDEAEIDLRSDRPSTVGNVALVGDDGSPLSAWWTLPPVVPPRSNVTYAYDGTPYTTRVPPAWVETALCVEHCPDAVFRALDARGTVALTLWLEGADEPRRYDRAVGMGCERDAAGTARLRVKVPPDVRDR